MKLAREYLIVSLSLLCLAARVDGAISFTSSEALRERAMRLCRSAKVSEGAQAAEELRRMLEDAPEDMEIIEYDERVRRPAMECLSSLGLEDNIPYFLKLIDSRTAESDNRFASMAQVGLWQSRVAAETDVKRREAMLVEGLTAMTPDGRGALELRQWSARTLCESGDAMYLPAIKAAITTYAGTSGQHKEARLCELKLTAVSASHSRVEALERALTTEDPIDGDFHLWALKELTKMESVDAERTLVTHGRRLRQTLEGGEKIDNREAVETELLHVIDALKTRGASSETMRLLGPAHP